jgi:hypothetical protein
MLDVPFTNAHSVFKHGPESQLVEFILQMGNEWR